MQGFTPNTQEGLQFVDDVLRAGRSHRETKLDDLMTFRVKKSIVDAASRGFSVGQIGDSVEQVLNEFVLGQDRLSVGGVTGLCRYVKQVADLLHSNFPHGGTIVDFGCGASPDISILLAAGHNYITQLIDISPIALDFSEHQVNARGINSIKSLVTELGNELEIIRRDVVMFVEITAFEHVPNIRNLFVPMMKMLPVGGLFLCNYTRVDWTNPEKDGFKESHDYALTAADEALKIADRVELVGQEYGEGYDLWVKR